MDILAGTHIREALAEALALAIKKRRQVEFEFNGSVYTVLPSDSFENAKKRAEGILGTPILSPEKEQEAASKRLEETEAKWAKDIADAKVPTEQELRTADVPWPKSPEELMSYITTLVDRPHDYGTCVYAMSMAATAAFYYVSGKLGASGFQAPCADLDFLRRTRSMEGPFIILKAEDLLYPQYDLRKKLEEFIDEVKPWLAEEAKKKLADPENADASPRVRKHWESYV